jgi:uncharacterized lipoprotein YehR (DUF1307 family)
MKNFYKKTLGFLMLALVFSVSGCGPSIYTATNFNDVKSQHKTVAILPFEVMIDVKRLPKGITQENLLDQQKSTGFAVQNSVYAYLLKEMSKNKFTVEFQDIDKTNSQLLKSGTSYEDLKKLSKEEACKILGVDAVIGGKVITSRPMSEGAAIAIGLLVGAWGNTNKATATVTLHDKADSKLLWKYDYEYAGSVGSSTQSLTNALMKSVSKKFPYKRS